MKLQDSSRNTHVPHKHKNILTVRYREKETQQQMTSQGAKGPPTPAVTFLWVLCLTTRLSMFMQI